MFALLLFLSSMIAVVSAETCCPYPVRRSGTIAKPSAADFKCSEDVEISCTTTGNYLEVAVASDVNAQLKNQDIIYAKGSLKSTLICNKSNGKWKVKEALNAEFAGYACAYKLPTGVWTYSD